MLSDYGYLCLDSNLKPIAVAWLYPILGSQIAWLAFPLANPETTAEERKQGLDQVFDIIGKEAKSLGFSILFTTTSTPPIAKRLADSGWFTGDINVTQYFRRL